MTILTPARRVFQRISLWTLALAAVALMCGVSRAADRAEAVKKLGFDPIEQPAPKWLPAEAKKTPNADAATAAEMKPYTETLPVEDIKFDMVPIKGGTFKMGSPKTEKGRKADEGPQVEVTLEPFWMGKCEVTWDEFETWAFSLDVQRRKTKQAQEMPPYDNLADAVLRPTKPYTDMSFDMGKTGRPAICMTQYAAQMYCKWLSAKTGRYYRLPTEAEWEYACRAGTETAYSFGDDPKKLKDYAWFGENCNDKYQKVGSKKPNPWGLYDMHGNVCEWVLDQYIPDYYKKEGEAVKNPYAVPTKEFSRAVKGGSWQDDPEALRSAARRGSSKDWKMQDPQIPQSIWWLTDAQFLGFRIVRPLRVPTAEQAKLYEPDPKIAKDYSAAQGGKQ